jgi:transcriptional regulator with XRE-family HTH domain
MLGAKIRDLRKAKGMTLAELAEKTQLSSSYISQLERDIIDPSLFSLRKISVAMGVPLYTFLGEESKQMTVIKADRRKKLELPESSVVYEFMTPMGSDQGLKPKMEIIYIKLSPLSWSSDEYITHNADECIIVLKGNVQVYLNKENYSLSQGDSIYISEQVPHKVYNAENQESVILSCICPPIY